ncbi:hypothetical protein M8J76_010627 [Diaphorina citri]|nr:hypothetical protein M8J75_014830 [Diaphorina citri]KAI5741130.1 hypothetical protein M8J76_010627 [Diaphorina citri]KAI5747295.1 hypothetical protein M8J77_013178 [Diaphorina citri]
MSVSCTLDMLSKALSSYLNHSPEQIDMDLLAAIMRCIAKLNILLDIQMTDDRLPSEIQHLINQVQSKIQTYDKQQLIVAKHLMETFLIKKYFASNS